MRKLSSIEELLDFRQRILSEDRFELFNLLWLYVLVLADRLAAQTI